MPAELKSSSHGQTMVLAISNPEARNALGPEIYAAGVEALNVADSNPEVRSVVITGEGSTFCAGGNLNRLLANRQKPPEVQAQSIEGLHNWIEAIRSFPKPVIAAVEGAAAGAGFSLALACDMLVAGERIDAPRLHALGVVNRLSDAGQALGEALALAEALNARAPTAMASIKELVNEATLQPLSAHLNAERDHFVRNLHHPNGQIGIEAFLGKTKPHYP